MVETDNKYVSKKKYFLSSGLSAINKMRQDDKVHSK